MTAIDYAARVSKGMALLDEKLPGWTDRINLETLDVSSGTHCVAAQLSGVDNYVYGLRMLGLEGGRERFLHGFMAEGDCECCNDGLTLPEGYHQEQGYATLTDLWRRAIQERRTADLKASEMALTA